MSKTDILPIESKPIDTEDDELVVDENDMYEDEEDLEELEKELEKKLEKKINIKQDRQFKQVIQREHYIVSPDQRITSEHLTYYEYHNIISIRAKHIEDGAPIYINIENLKCPLEIAKREIKLKKCPLSITRRIMDNRYEKWDINEMIPPKDNVKM